MLDRIPSSRLRNERRSASEPTGPRHSPNAPLLLTEPLVDLPLVRGDPLLRRLVGVDVVAGDVLRDRLLVRVRPAEPLEHCIRRRAALRELRAEHLVEDDVVVRALVLRDVAAGLRIVLAALEALRQHHFRELVLEVQVLRRVPVEEDRLVLLVELAPASDLRRLGADRDELEIEAEPLDQLLVLLDVGRVTAEKHPLRAGLWALEERLLALETRPRLELRVLLHQVRRDVPADVPGDAVRAAHR